MKIKMSLGFALVLVGTIVLSIFAAAQNNQFWSSPLIAIAVLFFIGEFPPEGKRSWFLWAYFALILGSGGLLLFTPQQIYWTTPLVLGLVLAFIGVPEIEFTK